MKAIICSAGVGSRLGLNIPKALIPIGNKFLIELQIEALSTYDITVVVGFKHDEVIRVLNKYNVSYIINKDYKLTNTSHSISLCNFNENCLILDGDLIFNPLSIKVCDEFVGICKTRSSQPVCVTIDRGNVTSFTRNYNEYEWACICCCNPNLFNGCTTEFVYSVLEKNLPIKYKIIESYEIDTKEDLAGINEWMIKHIK